MAGRSKYSEADKARVYVTLRAEDGNVGRTAKAASIPENTVRRWRDEWKLNGPPDTSEVMAATSGFLADAEATRDEALRVLRTKLGVASPQQLATIVGILDDKVARARGISEPSDRRQQELPSAEEIGRAIGGFMQVAIESARQRADTIEGEILAEEDVGRIALPG